MKGFRSHRELPGCVNPVHHELLLGKALRSRWPLPSMPRSQLI